MNEITVEERLDIMNQTLYSIESKLDMLIEALQDDDLDDADISPFGHERDDGQTL